MVAVFVRAVLGWYRRQARQRGVSNGRGGAVVIVQRFGSALNLNVHLHALVLDGVFARDADGMLRFHAAPAHPVPDLMPLLATIATRLQRLWSDCASRRRARLSALLGTSPEVWMNLQRTA